QLAHERLVEDAGAASRDRPHRQLRLPGEAELADEEDVERGAERARHLSRDREPATRQRQDDHVVAAHVVAEPLAEQSARFGPIAEAHAVAHRLTRYEHSPALASN